jgi:predicted branched-subunit amino acid permease
MTVLAQACVATSIGSVRHPASARVLALRDAGAVAFAMVPFGVTLGVTIAVLGFGSLPGLVGAFAVYGGSAQLTAVTLLHAGVGLVAVVLSAATVNSRLLLYSASLSWRFRDQPRWFTWLAPHFIIDQTFLLASARGDIDQRLFRRYWLWLGASVLVVWSLSIAAGMMAGPYLPDMPDLGFLGTTLFLGMLASRLTTLPSVAAAAAGGVVAATVSLVRPELGIICGALAGVAAGRQVQR